MSLFKRITNIFSRSDVADGATAIGHEFDTTNALSTSGAKLVSFKNNGTAVLDFNFVGGIDHANSGATTAAHAESLNLNWISDTIKTSSGLRSVVIGNSNRASSNYTFAGGNGNTVTASLSLAWGQLNTISDLYSVAFGNSNTIGLNTGYAFVMGKEAVVGTPTTIAIGVGKHTTDGDAQVMTTGLKVATADATQTDLTPYAEVMVIPADTTWVFSGLVAARSDETDGNVSAGWKIEGVLYRDESGNTTIQGVTVTEIYSGFTTAAVAVEADDTNEVLAIKVTGEATTNIHWTGKLDIAQAGYA